MGHLKEESLIGALIKQFTHLIYEKHIQNENFQYFGRKEIS